MRKIIFSLPILVVLVALGLFFLYSQRVTVVAKMISKNFGVPVRIEELAFSKQGAYLRDLWIGTPKGSRTDTSFFVEHTAIDTTLQKVRQDPRKIENIALKDIFVGIEYYPDQTTNWEKMLGGKPEHSKGKKYWIGTLTLDNLSVEITQANGRKKRVHLKERMVFTNIHSDEGLPIGEIQKAIFYQVLKDIFRKLNLDDLLKNLPAPNPLKLLFSNLENEYIDSREECSGRAQKKGVY